MKFTELELRVAVLTFQELTMKEIAAKLDVTERKVMHVQEDLRSKMRVRSKVGIAIYALQKGWVV